MDSSININDNHYSYSTVFLYSSPKTGLNFDIAGGNIEIDICVNDFKTFCR